VGAWRGGGGGLGGSRRTRAPASARANPSPVVTSAAAWATPGGEPSRRAAADRDDVMPSGDRRVDGGPTERARAAEDRDAHALWMAPRAPRFQNDPATASIRSATLSTDGSVMSFHTSSAQPSP